MTFSERPSVASIATVPETAASLMMSIPREKLGNHNLEKKSNVTSEIEKILEEAVVEKKPRQEKQEDVS